MVFALTYVFRQLGWTRAPFNDLKNKKRPKYGEFFNRYCNAFKEVFSGIDSRPNRALPAKRFPCLPTRLLSAPRGSRGVDECNFKLSHRAQLRGGPHHYRPAGIVTPASYGGKVRLWCHRSILATARPIGGSHCAGNFLGALAGPVSRRAAEACPRLFARQLQQPPCPAGCGHGLGQAGVADQPAQLGRRSGCRITAAVRAARRSCQNAATAQKSTPVWGLSGESQLSRSFCT